MNTVLLVEDSTESYELTRRSLGSTVKLEWVKTLAEAKRRLEKNALPNLVLLDLQLPDGDGLSLCPSLQSRDQLRHVPLILLTAKAAIADKIAGFSAGADDFIVKPFDPIELRSRVLAKLRKAAESSVQSKVIRVNSIEIDKDARTVRIVSDDTSKDELDLTTTEYRILLHLVQNPSKVITRDDLLGCVWGSDVHLSSRIVDTHVSKLRRKLGEHAGCIATVHGTGYRFIIQTGSHMIEGMTSKRHGLTSGSSEVGIERPFC